MKLSKADGKELISIAKEAVSSEFGNKQVELDDATKKRFSAKAGVFVTLTIKGELRGCIGFTDAMFPLWEAVVNAARAAAFEDPRFPPISREEFEKARFEVSVLTMPELIDAKPSEYEKFIEIGKHGLIVEMGMCKGLLLPQVFPEYNAGWKAALEMTCEKAGLPPGSWKQRGCKVYRFSAEIFKED